MTLNQAVHAFRWVTGIPWMLKCAVNGHDRRSWVPPHNIDPEMACRVCCRYPNGHFAK